MRDHYGKKEPSGFLIRISTARLGYMVGLMKGKELFIPTHSPDFLDQITCIHRRERDHCENGGGLHNRGFMVRAHNELWSSIGSETNNGRGAKEDTGAN